ncbi:hypothetical protein G2W53_019840 [Senna tora]|uniref:Uncharacterized protein n=1 Tax=Senna tora TaxID=362788 RepID=A0A834TXT3_9FABA|nr:hypothetical protein G2W53_019840 [Senna tora]
MRRLSLFLLILLIMTMLNFTRPRLVKGRVLASTVKEHKANINIVLRGASSSSSSLVKEKEEKDNHAENKSSRVLIGNEFHTMASGPSRKGSGH